MNPMSSRTPVESMTPTSIRESSRSSVTSSALKGKFSRRKPRISRSMVSEFDTVGGGKSLSVNRSRQRRQVPRRRPALYQRLSEAFDQFPFGRGSGSLALPLGKAARIVRRHVRHRRDLRAAREPGAAGPAARHGGGAPGSGPRRDGALPRRPLRHGGHPPRARG